MRLCPARNFVGALEVATEMDGGPTEVLVVLLSVVLLLGVSGLRVCDVMVLIVAVIVAVVVAL